MKDKLSRYAVIEELGGVPPYVLVRQDSSPVEPVTDYLLELLASDCSPTTLKSYALDLLDWFRFLDRSGVGWEQAGRTHVRDYVLHLRSARNPYRERKGVGGPLPGSLNERTGKSYLGEGYKPATINHRLTVVRSFYGFHIRGGRFLSDNPVPDEARVGRRDARRGAHHRPGDPWIPEGRSPYRQRQPKKAPRALSEELWDEVFRALSSDRDRAIFCLLVSSGARATELLGMRGADVDWGRQRVRLITKGTREAEWVAASADFFRWLARYLAARGPTQTSEPLWATLRGPRRPLNYQALRAIMMRVNGKLGTNLVLHDLRHTCAMRLAEDPEIPITDVQTHLRHKRLSSTEVYLLARPEEVIRRVQTHQQAHQSQKTAHRWTYDPEDLEVLLGEQGEQQ